MSLENDLNYCLIDYIPIYIFIYRVIWIVECCTKMYFFIILFKQFNNKVIYPRINGDKKGMFKFIFGRRFFFNQPVHVNVNFEVGAIAF